MPESTHLLRRDGLRKLVPGLDRTAGRTRIVTALTRLIRTSRPPMAGATAGIAK